MKRIDNNIIDAAEWLKIPAGKVFFHETNHTGSQKAVLVYEKKEQTEDAMVFPFAIYRFNDIYEATSYITDKYEIIQSA
jgi:hypothetical protein